MLQRHQSALPAKGYDSPELRDGYQIALGAEPSVDLMLEATQQLLALPPHMMHLPSTASAVKRLAELLQHLRDIRTGRGIR